MFRKGQRFEVQTPFRAGVLTMWRAPFTGGYEKTLPSGLCFVVTDDPSPTATAISADPYPAAKWEAELVEPEDIAAEKYGGYYLVIPFGDVTKNCILVS